MSSYHLSLFDNGSGSFNCVVHRAGTAPTGGTMIALPLIENLNGGGAQQVITAATNATPIVITTASAHGWAVNDVITIQGALVNTGANGTFVLSAASGTTATLTDSVGNGVYTASSGVATNLGRTSSLLTVAQAALRGAINDRAAGN